MPLSLVEGPIQRATNWISYEKEKAAKYVYDNPVSALAYAIVFTASGVFLISYDILFKVLACGFLTAASVIWYLIYNSSSAADKLNAHLQAVGNEAERKGASFLDQVRLHFAKWMFPGLQIQHGGRSG